MFVILMGAIAIVAAGQAKMTKTKSGLQYTDMQLGTGDTAKKGDNVTVHYTGWLYIKGQRDKKFDSSVDKGTPFMFKLGAGKVIRGWEEGVEGMKVGGKRELIIPPNLGYGDQAIPGRVPANSTLDFEVELLKVSN
jgi:FKBP-type peptidyl-prolyl cis-trans isomerase